MKKNLRQINFYTILTVLSICMSDCKKDKVIEPVWKQLNSDLSYGEVTDIDGNQYATINIGQQTWMAENLRTSRYANGDTIPNCPVSGEWNNLTSGAWVYYENNSAFNLLHGKLYNWYAIKDPKNICPKGWHVPSDEEWTTLLNSLGGSDIAGPGMKSRLDGAWATTLNGDAGAGREPNNESGFSAIASGNRNGNGEFILMSYRGTFWSTKEYNLTEAFYREIFWNGDAIGRYNDYKRNGYSCRCVKD